MVAGVVIEAAWREQGDSIEVGFHRSAIGHANDYTPGALSLYHKVICYDIAVNASALRQPSAFVPIAMSAGALAAVISHIAISGVAPQSDEGAAAHIWQLLMAGQIPVVAFHAIKWLPRNPKVALGILGLQLWAALTALAPVYWLGW